MSIPSIPGSSSTAALSDATLSPARVPAASATPAAAAATMSVAIPGSPFSQQMRVSPGSLVATPQIPPLLFDSEAETLLTGAVGSLVDTTA